MIIEGDPFIVSAEMSRQLIYTTLSNTNPDDLQPYGCLTRNLI